MHSSINIPNEHASEYVVGGRLMSWMSSGAEYLTKSPDDIVFEVTCSLISSEIFAIPKSQTSGSPLPVHDQPSYPASRIRARTHLVGDKHVFLRAFSQETRIEGQENSRISLCEMLNSANPSGLCSTYHSHVRHPVSEGSLGQLQSRATRQVRLDSTENSLK